MAQVEVEVGDAMLALSIAVNHYVWSLEQPALPCMYLAHHKPESVYPFVSPQIIFAFITVITIIITITIIIVVAVIIINIFIIVIIVIIIVVITIIIIIVALPQLTRRSRLQAVHHSETYSHCFLR